MLVIIDGYNKYVGNIGGGVTLLNTRIDVKGRIEFNENSAVFGGGIALSGRCLVSKRLVCLVSNCLLFRFYFTKVQVCGLKETEQVDLVLRSL